MAIPATVAMETQHASDDVVPSGWTKGGATPREHRIELSFAVKQRGLQKLHDTLMRVSDPASESYGQHLSNEEVNTLTAPAPEHISAVTTFLKSHGVQAEMLTPNQDFIGASVPVEVAERILSTEYVEYHHQRSGVRVSRSARGYSLPAEVAAAVDFV